MKKALLQTAYNACARSARYFHDSAEKDMLKLHQSPPANQSFIQRLKFDAKVNLGTPFVDAANVICWIAEKNHVPLDRGTTNKPKFSF